MLNFKVYTLNYCNQNNLYIIINILSSKILNNMNYYVDIFNLKILVFNKCNNT